MRHLVLGLVMAFLLVSNQAAASGTAPVAYLSTDAGPNLIAVDTSSSTVLPTSISVGTVGATYGVAVGSKGASAGKVYVTWRNGFTSPGTLYMFDTATRAVTSAPVGMFPRGVAISRDGSRVYVANAFSHTVSVIDAATNTVVAPPITGFSGLPWGITASPVKDLLYVTTLYGNYAVVKVETTSNQIVTGVPDLGGLAQGIAASPDGTCLYVADYYSPPPSGRGRVWVIDPNMIDGITRPVVPPVTVGPNPLGIAVTPDSKNVYVSNSGGNTVSLITVDPATVCSGASSPIASSSITVGQSPQGVSVSSDGGTVFVANWGSGNLTAISVGTNATRSIGSAGSVLFPVAFGNFVTSPTSIPVNFVVVPKVINPRAQGTIPVIIYGSKSFDVHSIDYGSSDRPLLHLNGMAVKFKPNGEPMANYGDFTGSGYDDVMVHFSTDGIQGTGNALVTLTLTGQTMCSPPPCTGTPIQGTATVTFLH